MEVIKIIYLLCITCNIYDGFTVNLNKPNMFISSKMLYKKTTNPYGKKYYEELLKRKKQEKPTNNEKKKKSSSQNLKRKFPVSKLYYEEQIKRLNSKNITIQNNYILGINDDLEYDMDDDTDDDMDDELSEYYQNNNIPHLRIKLDNNNFLEVLGLNFENLEDESESEYNTRKNKLNNFNNNFNKNKELKSENFEVIKNYNVTFKDVGGYKNVKEELKQCVDLLTNYEKYNKYNVRIPKGLILEGPPGTGKTLLAKALAGEANCGFIAVSGSDFQDKYVGVGSTRIKELFKLATKNIPCIIFIDEIDAVGRKRSTDGESSSNERDSTLNALLVELDGFKNNTGVFLVSATNRIDLLDSALTRPGRIDKKIYIGLPDTITRTSIIDIHIKGKPYDNSIKTLDLVEITEGLSGAQIENLLNEAMLNALRYDRTLFTYKDFDLVFNKMLVGWQPNEHEFTSDLIERIAIHEMGHAIVGIFSKHHSKMTKVVINLSSPKSPGYTVFETSTSNIYTKESLFEHLMILLSGRIAEEIFYGVSVTTGALNDFDEALKLAEKMVVYYGMGTNIIYPNSSDKYKEMIDNNIMELITKAYRCSEVILKKSKKLIKEGSEILKKKKLLTADTLNLLIKNKYTHLKVQFISDTNEKPKTTTLKT